MAAVSYSMARNGGSISVLAAGSQTVTEAAQAPSAGDIEVRFANNVPWTQDEIERALNVIQMYINDVSTSFPL